MKNSNQSKIDRREFLKLSGASLSSMALAGSQTACSTLMTTKLPKLNYKNGVVLSNCTIIDVTKGTTIPNKNITVFNEKIVSITDATAPVPENLEVIDLGNNYVIPGLIDAHCHSTLPCMNDWDPMLLNDIIIQCDRNFIQQIQAGVTTIRDAAGAPKTLPKFIHNIEKEALIGPRINFCTKFINLNKSHPDIDPHDISIFADLMLALTGNPQSNFTDTADLKRHLDEVYLSKPNFIKLTMDDQSVMCGKGKIPVYTDEHMAVIMNFAEKHNLPVSAHIFRKFGFDRAVQFGISSMEHTVANAALSDDDISAMAKKNIATVPTVIIGQLLAHEEEYDEIPAEFRNDFIDNERKLRREFLYQTNNRYVQPSIHKSNINLLKFYKKYSCPELYSKKKMLTKSEVSFGILKYAPGNLMKMKDAGILIGCGTDSGIGYIYHGILWREMELLSRIGFSNLEVLQCATINNAKILHMDDRIGSIEEGKYGDFAVLKENPLEKITAFRDPLMVIKGGKMMHALTVPIKEKNQVRILAG